MICGIGLPIHLDVEAVTIGYSFKFNTYLPVNASDFLGLAEPFDVTANHPVIGRSDHEIENASGYDDEQQERFERSMTETDDIESGTIRNDIKNSNLNSDAPTTRWLVYKGLAEIAEKLDFFALTFPNLSTMILCPNRNLQPWTRR